MTIQEKFDLKGKTAIITGGSGLLGTEFCRTMAEAGANVVVADIAEDAANETAQGLADVLLSVASVNHERIVTSHINCSQTVCELDYLPENQKPEGIKLKENER